MNGIDIAGKIALGTVQMGLAYGIANQSGQIQQSEAARLLLTARQAGMDTLDTAIAYGESEATLGALDLHGFKIVSKLPQMPDDVGNVEKWVESQFQGSLKRLNVTRLYGLLLHRPEQLLERNGDRLYAALTTLREQGRVSKIGISVYGPEELEAFEGRMPFDLIQAPFNPVDRRLVESGWLTKLSDRHVEVHVRSAFMQGLLLMGPQQRPQKFSRWSAIWNEWHQWLLSTGQTALNACLGFSLSFPEISRVVIGVDNVRQLEDVLSAAGARYVQPPSTLASQDVELLNPSLWSRL